MHVLEHGRHARPRTRGPYQAGVDISLFIGRRRFFPERAAGHQVAKRAIRDPSPSGHARPRDESFGTEAGLHPLPGESSRHKAAGRASRR